MNQLIKMQKGITEAVGKRIKTLEDEGLALPEQYSAKNALSSAFFTLQKVYGIEKATQESIANALLDMVTQGLSPAKTQCYFIVYGNGLQMQRSYFGTVAALKRLSNVDKVKAEVIHEGDVFEIGSNEDMEMIVTKFEPKFENMNKPIIGAFAMIKASGEINYTVMTKEEIDKSWQQSRNKNNKVQQNFGQEMAKRTVLNRAAKMFINTSDDSDLLTGAINNTTENEFEREEPKEIQAQEKQANDLINKALNKPEETKTEPVEEPKEKNDENDEVVIEDTEPEEQAEAESDENQTELFDEFGLIK